jgi:hypothetical protein
MAEPRVQAFFGTMLDLTGFPGVPGRDENISEVCAHRQRYCIGVRLIISRFADDLESVLHDPGVYNRSAGRGSTGRRVFGDRETFLPRDHCADT